MIKKKLISLVIAISAMLSLSIPSQATNNIPGVVISSEDLISEFYEDSTGYRILDKNEVDVTDSFSNNTRSIYFNNDFKGIQQYIRDNKLIVEKRWFSDAKATDARSSEVTRTLYVTRVETCNNTAYANAPDAELSYTVYLSFTYDPNTYRVSSYSEPMFRLVNQNWGIGLSNFRKIDTLRSSKLRANGVDVEANYYFKVRFDFRDDVVTVEDYKNVDFGTHGLTFVFNGDMAEHSTYE